MYRQTFLVVLLWPLTVASVPAEERDALRDPMRPYSRARSDATGAQVAPSFHVTGILISPSRRVAVVNGKLSHEGDRVDGAEILSIDARSVRVHTGKGEATVHLRSDAAENVPSAPTAGTAPELDAPPPSEPEARATPNERSENIEGESAS